MEKRGENPKIARFYSCKVDLRESEFLKRDFLRASELYVWWVFCVEKITECATFNREK